MNNAMEQNPYQASEAATHYGGSSTKSVLSLRTVGIVLIVVVGVTAGYLAVRVPWEMAVTSGIAKKNMVDEMRPVSLLLLSLTGFVLGILAPRLFWLGAVSELAAFPVIAFWEIYHDPTSHNLWPIEFIMYGFLTIPGLVAGVVGSGIHRGVRYMLGRSALPIFP